MIPVFRTVPFLLAFGAAVAVTGRLNVRAAGADSTSGRDSVAGMNLNELREKVEREERRKQRLFEQARREREMLRVVQEATAVLMGHYRTLRDLKEKNLTVAVLDSATVAATAAAAVQIKKAQGVVLSASGPQQVQVALDVTAQAVRNLERVFASRRERERALLAAVPAAPVETLRVRAIETIRDLKKGLSGRIRAESGARKLMIRNLGTLKADLLKIDTGIRRIEKAGSAERVGEVLAESGFDAGQFKLIERELGLKGRGREIVTAAAGRDPVAFRKKALALMRGMRSDVTGKIKAEYAGSRDEIGRLERLQAKLKRVEGGLAEVEKAGSGRQLGKVLAEIQFDLGAIEGLRTGAVPAAGADAPAGRPPRRPDAVPSRPSAAAPDAGAGDEDADSMASAAPARWLPDTAAESDTMPRYRPAGKSRNGVIVLALAVLAAVLAATVLSVRRLYVRD